ncbi:unnamed protein product [Meloidogyne enterolobii]|uniref:Uncharacterized protein n=1 Tax=Meloidogyne enterolobii TaxID=390850 RepID=A0ACB1A3P7_MELEN
MDKNPFGYFPQIQLCKEKPADDSLLGHIFCWGMICLYILFIISLIIYQLRSIFWFKLVLPLKNKDSELERVELENLGKR